MLNFLKGGDLEETYTFISSYIIPRVFICSLCLQWETAMSVVMQMTEKDWLCSKKHQRHWVPVSASFPSEIKRQSINQCVSWREWDEVSYSLEIAKCLMSPSSLRFAVGRLVILEARRVMSVQFIRLVMKQQRRAGCIAAREFWENCGCQKRWLSPSVRCSSSGLQLVALPLLLSPICT